MRTEYGEAASAFVDFAKYQSGYNQSSNSSSNFKIFNIFQGSL
jgi:hypothetical protein